MKMRRYNSEGIAAVRTRLAEIKSSGRIDLSWKDVADGLLTSNALSKEIPELADLDLDATRTFDTTFAFCQYFDGLMANHNPQSYRTDVGFWTWLAMVYLQQLAVGRSGKVRVGEDVRFVFSTKYSETHRHLLASPFYIYELYRDTPEVCKCVLWNKLWAHSDLQEQIVARQMIVQNPSLMQCVNALYFDNQKNEVKRGSGGNGPGSPRRFVTAVDQFALTHDFFEIEDAKEFLALLPKEFARFNPLKNTDNA